MSCIPSYAAEDLLEVVSSCNSACRVHFVNLRFLHLEMLQVSKCRFWITLRPPRTRSAAWMGSEITHVTQNTSSVRWDLPGPSEPVCHALGVPAALTQSKWSLGTRAAVWGQNPVQTIMRVWFAQHRQVGRFPKW